MPNRSMMYLFRLPDRSIVGMTGESLPCKPKKGDQIVIDDTVYEIAGPRTYCAGGLSGAEQLLKLLGTGITGNAAGLAATGMNLPIIEPQHGFEVTTAPPDYVILLELRAAKSGALAQRQQ